jgi:hypothetical protein
LIQREQELAPAKPENEGCNVEVVGIITSRGVCTLKRVLELVYDLPHARTMTKSNVDDLVDAWYIFFRYRHEEATVVV